VKNGVKVTSGKKKENREDCLPSSGYLFAPEVTLVFAKTIDSVYRDNDVIQNADT
jgi:hypothetical protein